MNAEQQANVDRRAEIDRAMLGFDAVSRELGFAEEEVERRKLMVIEAEGRLAAVRLRYMDAAHRLRDLAAGGPSPSDVARLVKKWQARA